MLKGNPGDILYFLSVEEFHQKAKTSNQLTLQTSIVSMNPNPDIAYSSVPQS